LIALEAHFLDIILQLAMMRQPLTAHGAISLINLLVETSHLRRDIMQWKAKHLSIVDDDEADDEVVFQKIRHTLERNIGKTLESGTQK
jgi:hypothetical protein